jgi:hypothetical protein
MFLDEQGATYPAGSVTQAAAAPHPDTPALLRTRSPHRDQGPVADVYSPLAAMVRPVSRAPRGVTPTTLVSPPVLQPLRI